MIAQPGSFPAGTRCGLDINAVNFFLMLKTYQKRKNGVVERQIGDELVLVDNRNGYVHQLNEVGACIWRNLMDDVSLETLAEMVCREFDVDAETARRDVDGFLSELSRLKMIEEKQHDGGNAHG